MKKTLYLLAFPVILFLSSIKTEAAPGATLTTSAIAAADINQGSTYNIVYAVKMKVTVSAVTINNIKFTLSGSYDNNDLTNVYVYYNASSPVLTGATYLGYAVATYVGPHNYSISISKAMATGDQGYYIIAVSLNTGATDNHTIQINGATNPVTFGYSVATTVTNNQSNKAGLQTIQAADITLTTSAVAAADINQGSTYNIVYAARMKVLTEPVTVNNIKFTLSGTHDNSDLTYVYVYYNAAAPDLSGASYLGYASATYSGPHNYSINISKAMAVGELGYFIIAISVNTQATDNHTIVVNGDTDPAQFSFTTNPNVTNNQTDKAKKLTIQAADITLVSSAVAAADINQGSTYNIVYVAKMKVITEPVTINNIKFTLSGTHDNSDLTYVYVYYNASSPVLTGASYLGYSTATYTSPHDYSINISKAMAVGELGYFIIAVSVSTLATDNHTIVVHGDTDPAQFAFTTDPNITNNQTDKAKKLTIQAADITLFSSAVAAADINQGSTYNIAYVAKMKVITEPVTVNNIKFTLSGTHDNSDLTYVYVYYNASSPVLTGASYLGYSTATYSAPHDYSINISKAMAVGELGYFIIAVSVNNQASDNHTIFINGDTDPVQFSFTTDPNITDNQSNKAKKLTIQAADITLSTPAISAGSIKQGSTYNVIYATQMKVLTEPVTVNNIQFTLSGNHTNSELTYAYVYYNASAPNLTGASYLGYTSATFSAPHDYSVNVSKGMAVGEQGYFIIAVSVSSTATVGKTVRINGATDPVIFGFTTAPNTTDNQKNNAGTKTISASLTIAGEEITENTITGSYVVNKVFPNPANSIFNFTITGKQPASILAQLTNRSGNIVSGKKLILPVGNAQYSMNVASLPNGVYYLVLIDSKGNLINRQQVNVQH